MPGKNQRNFVSKSCRGFLFQGYTGRICGRAHQGSRKGELKSVYMYQFCYNNALSSKGLGSVATADIGKVPLSAQFIPRVLIVYAASIG